MLKAMASRPAAVGMLSGVVAGLLLVCLSPSIALADPAGEAAFTEVPAIDPLGSGLPLSRAWAVSGRLGDKGVLLRADSTKPVAIADVDRADRYAFEDPFQDVQDLAAESWGTGRPGDDIPDSGGLGSPRQRALQIAGQGIQYGFGQTLALTDFGTTANMVRDRIGQILSGRAAGFVTGNRAQADLGYELMQSGTALALSSLVDYALKDNLSQNASISVSGGLNPDGGIDYTLDALLPLWESNDFRHTFFTQGSLGKQADAPMLNAGVAYRYMTPSERWMLGFNAFYDRQFDLNHQRMSIGVDAGTTAFSVYANRYIGLSGWKGLGDGFEERPANGWDLGIKGRAEALPQVTLGLKGYEWDQWRTQDPRYGIAADVQYQPAPALSLGLSLQQDSQTGFGFGVDVGLNLQFGAGGFEPAEPVDFDLGASSVKDLRYRKVERENKIVTERRKEAPRGYSIIDATLSGSIVGFTIHNGEPGASYHWTVTGPGGVTSGTGLVTGGDMLLGDIEVSSIATGAAGKLVISLFLTNADEVSGPVVTADLSFKTTQVLVQDGGGTDIKSAGISETNVRDLTLNITSSEVQSFAYRITNQTAALFSGSSFGALAGASLNPTGCSQVTGTGTPGQPIKADVSCLADGTLIITITDTADNKVLAQETVKKKTRFATTVVALGRNEQSGLVDFQIRFEEAVAAVQSSALSVTNGTVQSVTATDNDKTLWLVSIAPDGAGNPALAVLSEQLSNTTTGNLNRASDVVTYEALTLTVTAAAEQTAGSATFTAAFSAAVALTADALSLPAGVSLARLTGSSDGKSWTVEIKPTATAAVTPVSVVFLASKITVAGSTARLLADVTSPTLTVDTMPPGTFTVAAPAVNASNLSSWSFTLADAELNSKLSWQLVSGTTVRASSAQPIAVTETGPGVTGIVLPADLASGTYTLKVMLTDSAGNITQVSTDVQAFLTVVSVSVSLPAGQQTVVKSGSIPFVVRFSEPVDLSSGDLVVPTGFVAEIAGDQTDETGATWRVTLSAASDRARGATAVTIGFGQNVTGKLSTTKLPPQEPATIPTVTYDDAAPSTPTVSAASTVVTSANVNPFSFAIDGLESGATYRWEITDGTHVVDGAGTQAVTVSTAEVTGVDLSSLADGALTVKVWSTDAAGNESEAGTLSLVKDLVLPSFKVAVDTLFKSGDTPVVNADGVKTVRFQFENLPTDAASYSVVFTQGAKTYTTSAAALPQTAAVQFDLAAEGFVSGAVSFRVNVTDQSGNVGHVDGEFLIDALYPEVTGVSAEPPGQGLLYFDDQ